MGSRLQSHITERRRFERRWRERMREDEFDFTFLTAAGWGKRRVGLVVGFVCFGDVYTLLSVHRYLALAVLWLADDVNLIYQAFYG